MVYACQHFHQRGFAGAILADQRMYFAGAQLKLTLAERMDAREGLLDPFHKNQNITHSFSSSHSAPERVTYPADPESLAVSSLNDSGSARYVTRSGAL